MTQLGLYKSRWRSQNNAKKHTLNTAANLIGGISLSVTGYIAMELHRLADTEVGVSLPEWISFVGAGCFFVFGWKYLGGDAGYGGMRSLATGFRTMLLALMASCVVFGAIFIVGQLILGYYLDPFKTVFDWFRTSFDYFLDMFTAPVWITLTIGSLISGRLTGMANLRWR